MDFWGGSGDFFIFLGNSGDFFARLGFLRVLMQGLWGKLGWEMVIKLLVIVIIVTGVSFWGLKIDSGTRVVVVLGCFGVEK